MRKSAIVGILTGAAIIAVAMLSGLTAGAQQMKQSDPVKQTTKAAKQTTKAAKAAKQAHPKSAADKGEEVQSTPRAN